MDACGEAGGGAWAEELVEGLMVEGGGGAFGGGDGISGPFAGEGTSFGAVLVGAVEGKARLEPEERCREFASESSESEVCFSWTFEPRTPSTGSISIENAQPTSRERFHEY